MNLIDLKQIRDGSIVAIIENDKNEKNEIFILYNDFDDCNLNALKKCNNIIDADFDLNVHLSITTKNKQYDFVVK